MGSLSKPPCRLKHSKPSAASCGQLCRLERSSVACFLPAKRIINSPGKAQTPKPCFSEPTVYPRRLRYPMLRPCFKLDLQRRCRSGPSPAGAGKHPFDFRPKKAKVPVDEKISPKPETSDFHPGNPENRLPLTTQSRAFFESRPSGIWPTGRCPFNRFL